MLHRSRCGATAIACGISLAAVFAHVAALESHHGARGEPPAQDPVVVRLQEHLGETRRPVVLVVDSGQFPPSVWKRVEHLVAFRIHRRQPDGTTLADAATYLVRGSDLYFKAAATLRNRTTTQEYVWCLLAAVIAHEAAHTAPRTEREALTAEAAQLRRCLFAGHLAAGDGWNPVTYLGQVEARLRRPREHY